MNLRSCCWLAPFLGACGSAPDVEGAPPGTSWGPSLSTSSVPSEQSANPTTNAPSTAPPPSLSPSPSSGETTTATPNAPFPMAPISTEEDTSQVNSDDATSNSPGASEPNETGENPASEEEPNSSSTPAEVETSDGMLPSPGLTCVVLPITDEFRASYDLDPFYTRYADAGGLPVVGSDAPADSALQRVCELVLDMTMREDVREALVDRQVRFAVIGQDELTNEIPEFSHLPDSINQRARGLGSLPAASCAEESILCDRSRDRWRGEGICVHEFAHTISLGGLFAAIPDFQQRLDEAFAHAQSTGLFQNTYRMENAQEYWAEGVQDWYYTNLESDPANGVHNFVDRREELEQYDPLLHALIAEFLPEPLRYVDCYSDE